MSEKQEIFSSSTSYGGIFNFADFYKFCYDYLSGELGFGMMEKKYKEKVSGDTKEQIEIEWGGAIKVDDYFQYRIKVEFLVNGLKKIEVEKEGKKMETNKGKIQIKVKGIIEKDYDGKYETSSFEKFMRGVYNKWIIPSRVDKIEGKLMETCSAFLEQVKAYLDLEGKK